MKTKLTCVLGAILYLFMVLLPSPVWAESQNNYGVPDKDFQQWRNAYDNYSDKRLLTVSDSLMMKYRDSKNKSYMLMAYELQHIYYYFIKDEANFMKVVAKGKELSEELGMEDCYFEFCANEINLSMESNKHLLTALQRSRELMDRAEKTGDPVNMYLSAYSLGAVYHLRRDWQKAYDSLARAYEYLVSAGKENNVALAEMYLMMCSAQMNLHNYEKALETANLGLKNWSREASYGDLKVVRLACYFMQGKMNEFKHELANIRKDLEHGETLSPDYAAFMEVYDCLSRNDFEGALSQLNGFETRIDRLEAEQTIFLRQEDFKRAHDVSMRILAYNDSVSAAMENSDLEEISERLNANELAQRNAELRASRRNLIYLGIVIVFGMIVLYTVLHAYNRRRTIRKLAASNNALILAQDSERKALATTENALRRAEEALAKAEQAERMKRDFMANVSKEIRVPLNAISGFTQLLLDPEQEIPSSDKVLYNQLIQTNTDKLTKLVNNILEISNLETGITTMGKEPVDCQAVLEECQSLYHHDSQIELDLPEKPVVVHSDVYSITSILHKLVDNAVTFAPGTPLKIGVRDNEDQTISLYVQDHGPGIPEEMQFSIFERFKKVDENSQGLGLGLSVAKAKAESLGGHLILDVTYKEGCRFVLTIPKK